MAKKKINYKLFNQNLKERFLEQYDSDIKKHYRRYFGKAYKMEKYLNKDLCNFTLEELEEFLKSMMFTSTQAVHTVLSCITNYIDFAIEEGYSQSKMNWARTIKGNEELERYVSLQAKKQKYIDREELHNIMDFCINRQDAVIFGLLFEGIKGKDGLEELINLKTEDVNFDTGEITIYKNGKIDRVITIKDEYILETIQEAIDQEIYEKNNGINEHLKTPTFPLAQTNYILRPSGQGKVEQINEQTIYSRLKRISKIYGNSYLNPTNIWVSGMIEYAKKIQKEKGDKYLTMKDYMKINKRFGYDEYLWYTSKRRIKNYING